MKNFVVFIGEENKVNNELYQLFNWRFRVIYYNKMKDVPVEHLEEDDPALIIVSMLGKDMDFHTLFKEFMEKCPEIPVVTISTKEDSMVYEEYYENKQFHSILRPVTGKRIIEVCKAIMEGKAYTDGGEEFGEDRKKHILVVDDNAMVLRNIKGILEDRYSVAVAPSGFHALVSAGKKLPDLVLLDYEMPEMNGKDVMQKFQMDEELKEVPVVFLTSADSREIVLELLALKPAGYFLKPADSEQLLNRIEEIIGK